MRTITIVGGGLAGLVAATECAEAGARVRLLEARSSLGGRASTSPAPYLTNQGPHAFYAGPLWSWLQARDLHRPFKVPRSVAVRTRWRGAVRRVPPKELLAAYRLRNETAPVDESLRDWLSDRAGVTVAEAVNGLAGVLTFDHDPGRLSAAFVWEKVGRILFGYPPAARYVVGGWGAVVDRLGEHAKGLGVEIHTSAKVGALDDVASDGPVILALSPRAARELTGDASLAAESPRCALVDVAFRARRGDAWIVSDLDEGAFLDRFTAVDRTLAPTGISLVQGSMPQRPGEGLAEAVARFEAVLDGGLRGWREREVWRRRSSVFEATGAVDLPGTTWRDRPTVAWQQGVSLCGDWVAAPGHLAEVSWASAIAAARRSLAEVGAPAPSTPA